MLKIGLQFVTGRLGSEDNTIYTILDIKGKNIILSFKRGEKTDTTTYDLALAVSNLESKRWTVVNEKDVVVEAALIDKTAYITELFYIHITPLVEGYASLDKKTKTDVKNIGKKLNELLETFKAL
jgi:hypothetical protein